MTLRLKQNTKTQKMIGGEELDTKGKNTLSGRNHDFRGR